MKPQSILGALPILAKLLGDQCKVRVILNSPETKTQNGEIYLPALPLESRTLGALAYGYIVRESSRIRNKCDIPLESSNLHDALVQRINDAWIELRAQHQFPGARKTLNELLNVLIDQGQFKKISRQSAIPAVFMEYITLYLRTTMLEQVQCNEYAKKYGRHLDANLGPQLMNRVRGILDKVGSSLSLEKNRELAKQLVQLLRQYAENSESSKQPDSSQKAGTPDANDSQDVADGDQDGEQEPGNAERETQSREESEGTEGKDEKSCADAGSGSEDSEDSDESDAGEADSSTSPSSKSQDDSDKESESQTPNQNALENDPTTDTETGGSDRENSDTSTEADRNQAQAEPATQSNSSQLHLRNILDEQYDEASDSQKIASILDKHKNSALDPVLRVANQVQARSVESGSYLIDATREATTVLRAKMECLLESQDRRKRYFAKHGDIVPSRLWKIKTGNVRVFERTEEKKAVNTSVLFCVDCSDSMGSSLSSSSRDARVLDMRVPRINLAVQSVLAMTLALDGMHHVNSAAISFPSYDRQTRSNNGISVLTDFDEYGSRTADRFASLEAKGTTPLTEAVMWSIYKLQAEKSERRILFILTDGMPDDRRTTLQALTLAEQAGIEVMGLGIGLDIREVIRESTKVMDLNQMPKTVFEMLSRKLELLAA